MRVSALYVYPVKGCSALALDEAALGPLGLEHDRRFAFIGEDGRALTQREHPLLATVRPALEGSTLRLDFGGLLELAVACEEFAESTSVDVWGERIGARAASRNLAAGAAEYLGTRLRLVVLDPLAQRAFVDSQPVLVTTTAMLADLNARLGDAVGMERFRPNVVLEGEGAWRELRGRDAVLQYARPCSRCEVTTIDQASGARRGPEPLRTLSESFEGNFGVYCRVARAGRMRRGEALETL